MVNFPTFSPFSVLFLVLRKGILVPDAELVKPTTGFAYNLAVKNCYLSTFVGKRVRNGFELRFDELPLVCAESLNLLV